MLLPVEELKKFISTSEPDTVLEVKLSALERLIRKETNNNFQKRGVRLACPIMTGKLFASTSMLKVGDTVQISQSIFNDDIYTIKSVEDGFVELDKLLLDENCVVVTLVSYPDDVKMGAVNMLKWDLENRDKVGVQSETISRHSVTYFNMDGENSRVGYPKSLVDFLDPYRKARF